MIKIVPIFLLKLVKYLLIAALFSYFYALNLHYKSFVRKAYCILILLFSGAGVYAQNVAVVNGKPIGDKEFMWFYKKNHSGNTNASHADLEAYLNMYINFKLKVLDAKDLGLDRDTAYLNEVSNYEAALRAQKKDRKTNAEYSMIMNEYKEAVLMFNASELKIWNNDQQDQQELEREWIVALRKKYPVKINQSELSKLAKF